MGAPTTLIVDDSRLTRTIIKNALTGAGYEIVGEAVNGREGIELAGKLKPDLVTIDLTMPEKGGMESLEELRAGNPRGKVIIVTALGAQKLLQEDALKAGALAMIPKPFSPHDLVRLADRLLGRKTPDLPESIILPVAELFPETIGDRLTPNQIGDLMELGNIGAGNAASRLSDLIHQRCLISPPQVAYLKSGDIVRVFSGHEYFLVSVRIDILGDIPAVMVVALRRDQASFVVKYMTQGALNERPADISTAARFALRQVGEFLTRAFSHAVNEFLQERAKEILPEVTVSDSPEDLEKLLNAADGSSPHLLIHCGFSDVEKTFNGKLAYVLNADSQKAVLKRLRTLLV